MAGYVKQLVGNFYEGSMKLSGSTSIKTGGFVTPDYSDGEWDIPSGDAKGELAFVANEIDWTVPHNVDDKDWAVEGGRYVKAKPVIDKEVYITDMFGSAIGDISVDDVMGVGADGKLYLIAGLTATDFTTFNTVFVVKEKTKLMMVDALVVKANTNQKTA